jgi:hexosaminidase
MPQLFKMPCRRKRSLGGRRVCWGATRPATLLAAASLASLVAAAAPHGAGPGAPLAFAPPRLWPVPRSSSLAASNRTEALVVSPCDFSFDTSGLEAPALQRARPALDLYRPLILRGGTGPGPARRFACDVTGAAAQRLRALRIELPADALGPWDEGDEAYELVVAAGHERPAPVGDVSAASASLSARSYAGLLRGLETFSQLVRPVDVGRSSRPVLALPAEARIADAPSFAHRGVLLDVARNFVDVRTIQRIIDGLMHSKMNVLHLHLTDAQSIPLALQTGHGPNITASAAYRDPATLAPLIYSPEDVSLLQRYAAARGVTLVPEIDTPGHARAFGAAPGLAEIVACAHVPGGGYAQFCAEPPCGQLSPASELMYAVLRDAIGDVARLFDASPRLHLGWDEVNRACWTSDEAVAQFLRRRNETVDTMLKGFFARERAMLPPGRTAVYWDEVVEDGLHTALRPGDAVQFWHGAADVETLETETFAGPAEPLLSRFLQEAPSASNRAIVSTASSYYLDCGGGNEFGEASWCGSYARAFVHAIVFDCSKPVVCSISCAKTMVTRALSLSLFPLYISVPFFVPKTRSRLGAPCTSATRSAR